MVISGANRRFQPKITQFAIDHYNARADDVKIFFEECLDERRPRIRRNRPLAQTRCKIRENVQTLVDRTRNSRVVQYDLVGLILVKVRRCRCSANFDECLDFLQAERAEVERWKLFPELHVACFTPDHKIMEIVM